MVRVEILPVDDLMAVDGPDAMSEVLKAVNDNIPVLVVPLQYFFQIPDKALPGVLEHEEEMIPSAFITSSSAGGDRGRNFVRRHSHESMEDAQARRASRRGEERQHQLLLSPSRYLLVRESDQI